MRIRRLFCALAIQSGCHAYFHETVPTDSNPCGRCTYREASYWAGWWTTATTVATTSIEAVTVLVLTNDASNTTRTTTIFNFPSDAPVSRTDSDGHVIHTQFFTHGSQTSTALLTWPTGYVSYQQFQEWYGTMPVAAGDNLQNVTTTCSTAPSSAATLPFPTPIAPVLTAEGHFRHGNSDYNRDKFHIWTFYTGPNDAWCEWPFDKSYATDYFSAEPGFPVYRTCWGPQGVMCPTQVLSTQAYLTVTQTSADTQTPSMPPRASEAHIEETMPAETARPASSVTAALPKTTFNSAYAENVPTSTQGPDSPFESLEAVLSALENELGSHSNLSEVHTSSTDERQTSRLTTERTTADVGGYVASGIGATGRNSQNTTAAPTSTGIEQSNMATGSAFSSNTVAVLVLAVSSHAFTLLLSMR